MSTTKNELPPYSDNHVVDDHEDFDIDDHLPRYEESQQTVRKSIKTKDFLSTIENRGKPWAILTLTANEPLSKNIPTFVEGSPVKGTVKLSLNRPEYIYSVYISIKGDYLIGNAYQGENFTFLDITHTLWSPTYGQPFNVTDTKYSSSTPLPSGNNNPTLFNGPLSGEFSWPFAVNLPKTVVAPLHFGHREMGTFRLPHTFTTPGIRSTVVYTVTLTLKRHGILSVDDTLTTRFGYIPIIRPPPFPPLRQLAYQEGTPLLSPTSDPDGWHSLPPLELKANFFKSREAHVKCTLSLGKPLSYTRGTVVPLFLRLESEDEQGLELLASPKAIMARVRRRIRDHVHPGNRFEHSGWRDSLDHSQRAVWWPSGPKGDSGRLRSLQGEIHLKPGMPPTTALGAFRIEYSIVLFNFEAAGVDFPDSQILQEQPIEISTAFAPGPRPKAHTPAVYEPDTKIAPQSKEFSIGFY